MRQTLQEQSGDRQSQTGGRWGLPLVNPLLLSFIFACFLLFPPSFSPLSADVGFAKGNEGEGGEGEGGNVDALVRLLVLQADSMPVKGPTFF